MKKDYNQEKFKLNHNVVRKLLQKNRGKVDNRAATKTRMKSSVEIHTKRWQKSNLVFTRYKYCEITGKLGLQYFFNCRFLINKINYFDRITPATEVNDEIISLNVHVCVMVYNSIIILLIIDDVSLHSNYKATRLQSFTNSS